jgi:hypothetical protein
MIDSAYLIFNHMGLRRMVKGKRKGSARTSPALNRGEYAVLVRVVVPNSVFNPPPTAEATITVPEHAVIIAPPVVELTVNGLDVAARA